MNKMNNKLIKYLFGILCFAALCAPIYAADDAGENISKITRPIEQINPDVPKSNSNSISLSNSQFGFNWPLTISTNFSQENGFSLAAQYVHKVNEAFALAALFEYGPSTYRVGATAGFAFDQKHLFKLSIEQLSQVLSFDFDSGTINQRLAQNAIGAQYQYSIDNKFIQNVNFGAYYANTPNKELNPVIFESNGSNCKGAMPGVMCINFRNIAGGTSTGANVGADVRVTDSTLLNGKVYYDSVTYKTINEESKYDRSGLGWSAEIAQLFGEKIKATAQVSMREIYDTYQGGIYWITPFLSQYGLELSLVGQHVISHNQTPNDTSIGLNFSMSFVNSNKYQLSSGGKAMDIGSWVSTPAVHMARVLAIKDQRTEVYAPTINSVTPNSGSIDGGTTVTITGNRFYFPTAVEFGVIPAAIISWTENTIVVTTPPHAAEMVNVTIINKDGQSAVAKNAFAYGGSKKVSLNALAGMPHLTGRSVQGGHPSGGESVTIYGSDLGNEANLIEIVFVCGADRYSDKQVSSTDVKITKAGTEIQVITPRAKHTCDDDIKRRFLYFKYNGIASDNDLEFDLYNPNHYKALTILSGRSNKSCMMSASDSTSCNDMWYTTDGFAGISIEKIDPQGNGGKVKVEKTSVDGSKITFNVKNENDNEPASGKYTVYFKNSDGRMKTDDLTINSAPKINRVHTNNLFPDNTGSTMGGYDLIIEGENFGNTNKVWSVLCPAFRSDNVTSDGKTIKLRMPYTAQECSGQISVTNKDTGAASLYDTATKLITPKIKTISPKDGSMVGGTSLTITGEYLFHKEGAGPVKVVFDGKDGAKTVNATIKGQEITVTIPEYFAKEDTTVDVTARLIGGQAIDIKSPIQFDFKKPQIIGDISPKQGVEGTPVTINGNYFGNGLDKTSIMFDEEKAEITSWVNDKIEVIAPKPKEPTGGTVNITITKNGHKFADKPTFTYKNIAVIDKLSPSALSTAGGEVIIEGKNFSKESKVQFDGKEIAKDFIPPNKLKVTALANKVSSVNVTVVNPSNEGITPTPQTLKYMPSTIDSFYIEGKKEPIINTDGGYEIVIKGHYFNVNDPKLIQIGGVSVERILHASQDELRVIAPKHEAGEVKLLIKNAGDEANNVVRDNAFTYKKPTIEKDEAYRPSTDDNQGSTAGGYELVLDGHDYPVQQPVIRIGGEKATILSHDYQQDIIRVIVPRCGKACKTSTARGEVIAPIFFNEIQTDAKFIYKLPKINTNNPLSRTSGKSNGGDEVTIYGEYFYQVVAVKFGGMYAQIKNQTENSITVSAPRYIPAASPAGTSSLAGNTVNVEVINADYNSAILADAFSYTGYATATTATTTTSSSPSSILAGGRHAKDSVYRAVIKEVVANRGSVGGGELVTINGERLDQVTRVAFGNQETDKIIRVSKNSITVVAPSAPDGNAGIVNVMVGDASGKWFTKRKAYTYDANDLNIHSAANYNETEEDNSVHEPTKKLANSNSAKHRAKSAVKSIDRYDDESDNVAMSNVDEMPATSSPRSNKVVYRINADDDNMDDFDTVNG